jgi:CYTH domain-containing protein
VPSGLEIERKFLVDRVPADLGAYPSTRIEQGYLAITDDAEVRLRRAGPKTVLTIKSSGDRERVEEELELDPDRFATLWPLTAERRLEKTRYAIPIDDDHTIELDVYEGDLQGLVIAEVEFETADAASAFVAPSWFGREVTEERGYKNQRLATRGSP